MEKEILIAVIDGQGGGIGRSYIQSLKKVLPKDKKIIIRALGTNSTAADHMRKGGATDSAAGENAIIRNAAKADIIVGLTAIVIADSILGEISPAMSKAVGESPGMRILIPFDSCNTRIAMAVSGTLQELIDRAVVLTLQRIDELMD